MGHETIGPHVLASQVLYTAKLTAQRTPGGYEAQVLRQPDRIKSALTDRELAQVEKEIQLRLTVTRMVPSVV